MGLTYGRFKNLSIILLKANTDLIQLPDGLLKFTLQIYIANLHDVDNCVTKRVNLLLLLKVMLALVYLAVIPDNRIIGE